MTTTRNRVIAHHVSASVHRSALTMNAYVVAVAEHYLDATPRHLRTLKLERSTDRDRDLRNNTQTVQRMLDGITRMPVEVEEALVLSLPDPYRADCLRDLADRLGLLAARKPSTDGRESHHSLSDLLRETGQVVEAMAPMLADGRIDDADRPFARHALQQITDALTALVSLQQQVVAILPSHDVHPNHKLRAAS